MTRSGVLLLLASWTVQGASTSYWEMNSYSEFLKGRLEGLSLTREGKLLLAPRTEILFSSDQPVIWSLAQGPRGVIYVATGHRGQIFRIDAAGKSELLWTAPEPEVFAIALDAKGTLYAGTSPDGRIYRIESGKATEYFAPKSKYIWSLAFAPDGALFAGTGDEGKVFRISNAGVGEVWYETGQSNVTSLALDREGRLLAGTDPNGVLYRIAAKDKAFVLYDSNLPEIRAVVPATDGSLYVAALGGAFGKKQAGAAGAVANIGAGMVTAPAISITVEAAKTQGGLEIKPKPEPAKPQPAAVPAAAAVAATPVVDLAGVDKAAVYRIHPDNLVETLWVSREENIYDLAASGPQILFSTDGQGRIYSLDADRRATLIMETREGEATRLLAHPGGILAATSHAGKLLRIGVQPGATGSFESPVHDATNASRWGRITWRAELPLGTAVAFRTRTGNSARPDKAWSDWSEPVRAHGAIVRSPNARYIQWKAEFQGSAGGTPQLDAVTIAYLPQNSPPAVKSIQLTAQPAPQSAKAATTSSSPNAVYSITVSDTGDSGTSTSAGNPTQTVSRGSGGQLVITWQAEDTDGDKLAYSIYFRGEEERDWKLLKANWNEQAFTLDGDSLADGKYIFRVVATDAPSNPSPNAREGELVSAQFLVDNTPPVVLPSAPRRNGATVELEMTAQDSTSAIRRAEYSLNAGPWMPLMVDDGVADSPQERFRGTIANVPPGEHLIVLRAYDSAGNAGLAKVILR
ncbi:MAG TPA: WD40 repeat domain-containing protein [Bryobacteraceae bacterium]|nr:WD40 repeat domain-containing protein [Bryobacteraceae bacterium]